MEIVADEANGLRIDELAQRSGTTVRNIRAYQERGLVPPPRRQGRIGLYSEAHVIRLRLISDLLERGYTLNNIAELLSAWERGQDIASVLGFEAAIGGPWSEEEPLLMGADELTNVLRPRDGSNPEESLTEAIALGLLEPEGDRFRVRNPHALKVGALLIGAGVPIKAMLGTGLRLRDDIEDVARQFVDLVDVHVIEPLGDAIQGEDVPRLARLVEELRPLAKAMVDVEFSLAMERQIWARFGERLRKFADRQAPDERDRAS